MLGSSHISIIPAGSKKMVFLNGLNQRLVYVNILQERSGISPNEGCLGVFSEFHVMKEPGCSKRMLLTTLHGILLQNVSCWWLLSDNST